MGRRFGAACVFTADQRGGPQPLPPCCRLAWGDPRSDRRPRQLQRAAVRSSESPIPTWRGLLTARPSPVPTRQAPSVLPGPRGSPSRPRLPAPHPCRWLKAFPAPAIPRAATRVRPGRPEDTATLSGSSHSATGACRGTGGRRYLNKQSDRCRMSCVGGGMAMGESAKSESPRHVTGHDSAPRCARVFPPDSRSLSALGCRRLRVPVAPGTVSLMRVG